MGDTVSAEGSASTKAPILSHGFHRVRRPGIAIGTAITLGVIAAVMGKWVSPIPTADMQASPPAMWRFLLIGPATLPILSLHSPLACLESVSTVRFHRAHVRFLIVVAVACSGSFLAASAIVMPLEIVARMARGLPGWFGLALISGCLLGWRLAWTVPVCLLCPMLYWGTPDMDGRYPWWEFSAPPASDPSALLLNASILAVGILFYWMTPWRRQILRKLALRTRP